MEARDANAIADQLNAIYEPLEMKACQLLYGLHHRIFDPKLSYYSGHYRRAANGEYTRDSFPIPVVEVPGFCDVEINLDSVTVTAKLRRDEALVHSYEKLLKYEFEAYGVREYTHDFYTAGMTIEQLKENIRRSKEKEIGFTFRLDFDIDGERIYEFAKLLRREGFYY